MSLLQYYTKKNCLLLHEKKLAYWKSVTTPQTAFAVRITNSEQSPIRPTPILGLTRPGKDSFYHARERRRAAGESRQHA